MPHAALPSVLASAALALSALPAGAQLVHRGATGTGQVTETVSFVDTWEDGGGVASRGSRDVLVKSEEKRPDGEVTGIQLLLLGPWGSHLYAFDEQAMHRGSPVSTGARTLWRAVDLDDDGSRELVLVERTEAVRTALDETGHESEQPGPFFDDYKVKVRYLAREAGTLVEHDMTPDPAAPPFAVLLRQELGGPVGAALQIAAADWLFENEKFDLAKYRYQVAREWAERALSAREVSHLALDVPLPSADPDEAAAIWMAAVRRIGALPRWYQKH